MNELMKEWINEWINEWLYLHGKNTELHENTLKYLWNSKILEINYLQESIKIICIKYYRTKTQFKLQKEN